MAEFVLHTMKFNGGLLEPTITMVPYTSNYYEEYKRIYEDCFCEMRTALQLYPINSGDSRDEMDKKASSIFLYIHNGALIGSVAIYNNEIDDLIVAREYQKKGFGRQILHFAINHMQRQNITPIILTVIDWNKSAIRLYQNNGFHITKSEVIKHTV